MSAAIPFSRELSPLSIAPSLSTTRADRFATKDIAIIAAIGLFSLAILPGAIMDILQPQVVVQIAEKIGLPLPIMTLVGVWKLGGLAGLAQPKFARLREWA